MPEIDLSSAVPPEARWVKLRYEIIPKKPGAQLVARVWSGKNLEEAVRLDGPSGEATLLLTTSRRVSYQFPVTVELKLKIVAYSTAPIAP